MVKKKFNPEVDNLAPRGDEFYAALMSAHDGLTPKGSEALNARLILLMANQIGNVDTLKAIIAKAESFNDK
jgi:hypothetical protein